MDTHNRSLPVPPSGKGRAEMKHIVSFDPGLATGVAFGSFSKTQPLEVYDVQVVPYQKFREGWGRWGEVQTADYIIGEVFTARPNNPFAPDLHGVRVEGMIDLMAYPMRQVAWRSRTKKDQVADSILKKHGLWRTARDVEWTDGRDVNDAIIHMLGFVAFDLKHTPTLRKYFRD